LALRLAIDLARHAARQAGNVVALRADGRLWHGAGASEAQELAAVLATAVAYLRLLADAGLEPAEAARQITVALAADTDFFPTVGKIRAFRRLWAGVLELAGAAEAAGDLRIAAETATRIYARSEPHTNLLRGTIACFAAAAGGADSITVLPFDHALGPPAPLARRLARNTSLILMEESNLHRVADPAGGAWYVESLSEEIAQAAWRVFQQIEAAGGMLTACQEGIPHALVAATRAAREADLASGRDTLVGVSDFVSLGAFASQRPARSCGAETERLRQAIAAATPADTLDELLAQARAGQVPKTANVATPLPVLPQRRYGASFEALRMRGERAAEAGRPRRVLLIRGPRPGEDEAALSLARRALGAGGFEVLEEGLINEPEAAALALHRSGARAAVLCPNPNLEVILPGLRSAGCEAILLVGDDTIEVGDTGTKPVVIRLGAGDDRIEVLRALHDRLDAEPLVGETAA
jgi:methylmalonyl-CoA mutase